MNSKRIFLISYDISDDRRRNKLAKLLEQHGYDRIQYSVFTGLSSPHRNKGLWGEIQRLVPATPGAADKIICFAISKAAFRSMKIVGIFTGDMSYLLGLKHTIIF